MRKQRQYKKRPVDYQYLIGYWKGEQGFRVITAVYRSTWGYVRILGFERSGLSYLMIHDGVEYELEDSVNYRTQRGIRHVASRFAREVVRGEYD